ncbi:MAG: 23S rRNA (adenine(2503)-C(2))-methyltransferase RlmN [Proteobacteria bacterium]|nr:23S rRNA (adenine(2503)-C(2))-methyltransferase RlmN [Pseudomonadota bacterium]
MTDIKNLSLHELEAFLAGMGKEKYRAAQVFKWIYQKDVEDFDEMTDLSKEFRSRLKECAVISSLTPEKVETSRDGTKKFLFTLDDGEAVESVLIPDEKRMTLCISSQVGCPLDCGFCLTGTGGYERNLTTAEIINQITAVKTSLQPEEKITNIVFMGMGEPLLNLENVVRAIDIMIGEKGMLLPKRKVTLSTAGLVPQIEELGSRCTVNLAVSLNATTNDIRSRIMPINEKYPIEVLLDACKNYPLPNRGRITFEYVMIKGLNDSLEDARRLISLLRGIPSKVNLIPFNEFEGSTFQKPDRCDVDAFHKYLHDNHLVAITRSSKGDDISAACGQLRGKLKGRNIA